jgi:hypothetical protein
MCRVSRSPVGHVFAAVRQTFRCGAGGSEDNVGILFNQAPSFSEEDSARNRCRLLPHGNQLRHFAVVILPAWFSVDVALAYR